MNPTVAVIGILRFPPALWPDSDSLREHLRAAHIDPWGAAARACGLLERSFTAYEISGSRPV